MQFPNKMKTYPFNIKYILLFALTITLSFNLNAQSYDYQFNTGIDGFSICNSTRSGLTLRYSINNLSIENTTYNDASGDIISLHGIFLPGDPGKPNLPSSSRYVAIPKDASIKVSIKNMKTKNIDNVDILPAPEPVLENDNNPIIRKKDESVYNKNAFYPENQIAISEITQIRDVDVAIISVNPFQYNPVTKQLIVAYDIELNIEFEGGKGTFGDPRYRSDTWNQIISDMVINNDVIEPFDYKNFIRESVERGDTGCEYLIITPDNEEFIQLADSIKLFRSQQGILTKVVTVSECGGNDYNTIRSYINNAYNTWDVPPSAVLFLGDHNTDGTKGIVSHNMYNHPGGDSYNPYISDNPYGITDNSDLPNIITARITGRDYDELYHIINKDLRYERNPPTNSNFYDKPITAMGYQLERWFQLCSEVVNGFWEHGLGKHPVRLNAIYEGTPGSRWSTNENTPSIVNYFGPNNLNYIPQTMSHLTEWDAKAADVNEAINNGAFILQHRDHGAEELWGEPSYSIGSIKKLTNEDLTFVMSNNCLTGKFNYGGQDGCFAEAFHRHQYGALGLIAATEVSYSFVNDVYVWGAYDNMWPEFMPDFGTQHPKSFVLPSYANVSGKYFLKQSSWVSSWQGKEITYYLFHHHGDAYMNLYTEMPQHLTVDMLPVLKDGATTYQITADKDATICLSVGDEIIGLAYATGLPMEMTVTPQSVGTEVILTVTKQNYYRYTGKISVIPNEGPYLIFDNCTVNNNNSNNLDYNETASLNVALHNVGTETINDVTAVLSTTSPYVEILNNTAVFNSISIDDITSLSSAFEIRVSDDVPDMTYIPFTLSLYNNDYSFTDDFKLPVFAPSLMMTNYTITDENGNATDRLQAASISNLTFTIKNQGHNKSNHVNIYYKIFAPFISVNEDIITIEGINSNDSTTVTFTVNVNDNSPMGAILTDRLTITSGKYQSIHENTVSLGNTTENFENETLNSIAQWSNSGAAPWVLDDTDPYEGNYCYKSTSANSIPKSTLIMGITTDKNDKISFYFKPSDNKDDKFIFKINTETFVLEGEGWTYFEQPIEAGQYLLQWVFSRESGADHGDARIDLIRWAPSPICIIGADDDIFTCEDQPATTNTAYGFNYKSILWSSDGDGYFENPQDLVTSYTPGPEDISNGTTILNLTAMDNYDMSYQSSINLYINNYIELEDTIHGISYIDIDNADTTSYHIVDLDNVKYHWNIEPQNAAEIVTNGNKATLYWNNNFKEPNATLSVYIDNGCQSNTVSKTINMSHFSIDENDDMSELRIYPNPAKEILTIVLPANNENKSSLEIFNILGNKVLNRNINPTNGSISLDVSSLAPGVYIIKIISGSHNWTEHVVIQN